MIAAPVSRRHLLLLPLAPLAQPWRAAQAETRAAVLVSEARPAAGFDHVTWAAIGSLELRQSGRERLLIEAESEVLRHIVTRVQDSRLDIRMDAGRVVSRAPIRFLLEVKRLGRLELRGSGHVVTGALTSEALAIDLHGSDQLELERVQARRLELRHAGAGDVLLRGGRVDEALLELSGAGLVDALALDAQHVHATLAGSGQIRVGAHARLDARVDGSGDIVYRGRPEVHARLPGAGVVRRAPND